MRSLRGPNPRVLVQTTMFSTACVFGDENFLVDLAWNFEGDEEKLSSPHLSIPSFRRMVISIIPCINLCGGW